MAQRSYIHILVRNATSVPERVQAIIGTARASIFVIDAKSCRTREALFDALEGTLRFPNYFGRNWDALDECLADLSWLPSGPKALVFKSAHELLGDEPVTTLSILLDILQSAAVAWSECPEERGVDNAEAIPFYVFLVIDAESLDEVLARVRDADVVFSIDTDRS